VQELFGVEDNRMFIYI